MNIGRGLLFFKDKAKEFADHILYVFGINVRPKVPPYYPYVWKHKTRMLKYYIRKPYFSTDFDYKPWKKEVPYSETWSLIKCFFFILMTPYVVLVPFFQTKIYNYLSPDFMRPHKISREFLEPPEDWDGKHAFPKCKTKLDDEC